MYIHIFVQLSKIFRYGKTSFTHIILYFICGSKDQYFNNIVNIEEK